MKQLWKSRADPHDLPDILPPAFLLQNEKENEEEKI